MVSAGMAAEVGPLPSVRPGDRSSVYLQPGHVFASAGPTEATTVLGSCVAVCLWDRRLRIGGANHFLLPYLADGVSASPRYGNVAIERLIGDLERLGSHTEDLVAKVFGGASVLEAFRDARDHLGVKNVDLARRILDAHAIPIVAEDVMGVRGRKLVFHTDSGIALVRLL
jgi:chemotaxis protein CheD